MRAIKALRAVQIAEVQAPNAPTMKSSAVLCASDARSLYERGQYQSAHNRAVTSLEYSLGIFSKILQGILAASI